MRHGWLAVYSPTGNVYGVRRSAILLARTQRCGLCEADAYDATMMREFPQWFVPYVPVFRAVAAARVGVASC